MYGLAVRFSKAEMSSEERGLMRVDHDGIQLAFLDLCPTKIPIVTWCIRAFLYQASFLFYFILFHCTCRPECLAKRGRLIITDHMRLIHAVPAFQDRFISCSWPSPETYSGSHEGSYFPAQHAVHTQTVVWPYAKRAMLYFTAMLITWVIHSF